MKELYLRKLTCIEPAAYVGNDECLLEITSDIPNSLPVLEKDDMDEGVTWDLKGVKISYLNSLSIKLLEVDVFFDDDLGTVTFDSNDISTEKRKFTNGCEYELEVEIFDVQPNLDNNHSSGNTGPEPKPDIPPPETTEPVFDPSKVTAVGDFDRDKGLKTPNRQRWILSLDAGGMKGIVTLYALRELERYYGRSCHEMFDMFAGTSTGSIIAACLASNKKTVSELILMYENKAEREAIFADNKADQITSFWNKKFPFSDKTFTEIFAEINSSLNTWKLAIGGALTLIGGALILAWIVGPTAAACTFGVLTPATALMIAGIVGGILLLTGIAAMAIPALWLLQGTLENDVAPMITVPKYAKGVRSKLKTIFEEMKLSDIAAQGKDLLIPVQDMIRNETTYITAFRDPSNPSNITGTYKDMKVRHAVEASTSAPTFFNPINRFVDGGVGAFGNPCFAAAEEALAYSHLTAEKIRDEDYSGTPFYKKYEEVNGQRSGTVVWSFGALGITEHLTVDRVNDEEKFLPFWLTYVVDETFSDASDQQNYLCAKRGDVRFHRFSLTASAAYLSSLGAASGLSFDDAQSLVGKIKMDAIRNDDFAVLKFLADFFARRINTDSLISKCVNSTEKAPKDGMLGSLFHSKDIVAYRNDVIAQLNRDVP